MLPTEATEFSYWVTHNLPLDNDRRDSLLKMDCPIQRLRKQLEIMQKVCFELYHKGMSLGTGLTNSNAANLRSGVRGSDHRL
jgi:hypothetical protein